MSWMDGFGRDDIEGTVMQSTGLKDKNGTLIYEGDIVKTFQYGREKIVAVSIDDCVCFPFNPWSNGEDGWTHEDNSEIIGNIYENKELLTTNQKGA